MSANHLTKIAIVGAGGNSGSHIASSLLSNGRHTLTAITRAESKTALPSGITAAPVDYSNPSTVVDALRGQDALVITLSGHAGDTEMILIKAAAEAGVKWVLPNDWSPDTSDPKVVEDVPVFEHKAKARQAILDAGMSYISVTTGFWYEWSLAIPLAFGFDIQNRKVTLFDDGETKISISTWPHVGRAVAALLSLPTSSSSGPSLDNYRNTTIYTSSFTLSQTDMFASLQRVTNTTAADWTITHEPVKQRYADGLTEQKQGNFKGMAKQMYGRVFFPDGNGDFSAKCVDGVLGTAGGEELDDATARAVERSRGPTWP